MEFVEFGGLGKGRNDVEKERYTELTREFNEAGYLVMKNETFKSLLRDMRSKGYSQGVVDGIEGIPDADEIARHRDNVKGEGNG